MTSLEWTNKFKNNLTVYYNFNTNSDWSSYSEESRTPTPSTSTVSSSTSGSHSPEYHPNAFLPREEIHVALQNLPVERFIPAQNVRYRNSGVSLTAGFSILLAIVVIL